MTVSTIYRSFRLPLNWFLAFWKPVSTIAVIAACSLVTAGQGRLPSIIDPTKEDQHVSSMEAEMRAKREIEESNKAHKENLNRARNLVSLSESLVKAFKRRINSIARILRNLKKPRSWLRVFAKPQAAPTRISPLSSYPQTLALLCASCRSFPNH